MSYSTASQTGLAPHAPPKQPRATQKTKLIPNFRHPLSLAPPAITACLARSSPLRSSEGFFVCQSCLCAGPPLAACQHSEHSPVDHSAIHQRHINHSLVLIVSCRARSTRVVKTRLPRHHEHTALPSSSNFREASSIRGIGLAITDPEATSRLYCLPPSRFTNHHTNFA